MNRPPRHVLIVDDDPRDRELMQAALRQQRLPHVISMVQDGLEALERLRSVKLLPDLILLDLKMPRMSGLDVLKALRSDPTLRLVPVVMLTSSIERRNVLAAYAAGANAYLQKPMEFDRLVHVLAQIMDFWTELNLPPPDLAVAEDRD